MPIYRFPVILVGSASQGDFHWYYENLNGIFNQGTFDYVSARVSPDDIPGLAQISPAGGFPNAYIQVVTAIYYLLGKEDEARLQRAVADASAQATVVVHTYQRIFGEITADQMSEGQAALGETAVSNKQDYVIGFVMGYLWSGQRAQNRPALAYTEMAAAPDLAGLLPLMPAPGEPVPAVAQEYLRLLGPANALEDQMFLGGWTLAQLRNNTAGPNAANGGMKTVNPNTGGISEDDQVGYGVGASIAALQRELNDPSRLIRAVVSVVWDAAAVHSPGQARLSVESLLHLVLADGSRRELLQLEGTGGQATITIDYPGFTMVPTGPRSWLEQDNTGWFHGGPIAEANRNRCKAVSGFHFTVPPAYNLGPLAEGGDFGLITHLLISNPPIVTIHFREGDLERFSMRLAQGASGRLGLFGPGPERRSSAPLYSVSYSPLSGGGFALNLAPVQLPVPPLQQTAYVIGGTFDFPGALV
ncbi:MAG TPA: hypothetical protein VLX28_20800 [Thermoanaerobaculia bacterium]|nr:hypothetical protein [Thermoanaerobaculia bacterium]